VAILPFSFALVINAMSANAPVPPASTDSSLPSHSRDILGPLGVALYAVFTLLPDSSTLLVSWPWVFIWQVALFLPWFWLLRQWWVQGRFVPLGYGLDCGTGLAIAGLILSTLFAQFPQQARWYGWAAICGIAALYALNDWMQDAMHSAHGSRRRQQLLQAQGGLSLAFIGVSLLLWVSQTLLPELQRLQGLRALGLKVSYDFSVLELRNWAPIGHQNYVAGYLALSLPLLLGLSLSTKTPWRWLWGIGTGLGIVDLYTTSSRGGWLGLGAAGLCGIALLAVHPRVSVRWRWAIGLGFIGALGSIMAANNRLRSLFSLTSSESGGELAFRLITNATGWAIGLKHPLFGAGPGSVPLLDQAYRPVWAGREAELVFQLHSTPAQLWAELGLWGVALSLGLAGWLAIWGVKLWRSGPTEGQQQQRTLCWSLFAGLLGYGIVSITDYQLDMVCISGTLIVYLAGILSFLREYSSARILPKTGPKLSWLRWGTVGLLLAVGFWLAPVHWAWQRSSLGFNALNAKEAQSLETSIANLQQARELAPWEPYYSAELGSSLVKAGLLDKDAQARSGLIQRSIEAFQQTVAASPYQEYGYSSLGWLQLATRQPQLATQSFKTATQLVPAKRGVFYSLGLSLLDRGQKDLAVQAMTLEIVRDPLWLTSPVWRSPRLAAIAPKVQTQVVSLYQQLLQHSTHPTYTAYLHQCLGGVYWWQGKYKESTAEWSQNGTPLSQTLLAIAQGQSLAGGAIAQPQTPGEFTVKAWLEPQQRTQWVTQALLRANQSPPSAQQIQPILAGMSQAKSLDEWIKLRAPTAEYRRERAGFGVLSRHIDGPAPQDLLQVVDNTAMTLFFSELLPSANYSPPLDEALQPLRLKLWQALEAR
jgi:uncharacterized protein involved in response to NO